MRSIDLGDGKTERRTAEYVAAEFPEIQTTAANLNWIRKRLAREL